MSSLQFRRIQAGKESTRGDAVDADIILRGKCSFTPHLELHTPEEEANSLNPARTATIVGQFTPIKFDGTANFEQIIHFLNMVVKPGAITTPGGGTDSRTHTYTPTLTALQAQNAYTWEMGDSQQEYECDFVVGESMQLTCEMLNPWMLSASLFGSGLSKSTFTGSITETVLEPIVATKTKLFVDTSWAGLGGTQVTGTLASATITIPSGLQRVWTGDTGLEYGAVSEGARRPTIELKLIHNASGEAQYDLWAAQTLTFIQLNCLGSLIEGSIFKQLILNFAVRWDSEIQMQQEHMGQNALVLAGTCYADPTSGKDFEAIVTNTITEA